MPIKKPNLSSLVRNQLPEFIREDYQTFIAFLEAYYEFLKRDYDVNLLQVRDIDNTLDQFIKYFKREFAIDVPNTLVDDRFIISKIKDYYLTKGTDQSFYILMAMLFGKDVTVEYPSRQMLRASDGKWNQDVSVFAKVNAGNPNMVIGRLVDVVTPTKIIKVQVDKTQNVEIEVDRIRQISSDTYEFYIDRRFFGNVSIGDRMRYSNEFDATILATTSKVQIQRPGKHFKPGELYEVKNGDGSGSILKVSRVNATGGIEALEFVKFGIGYNTDFTATLLPLGGTSATTAGSSSLTIGGATPDYSVGLGETTNGFFEQGYINKSDYNAQASEEIGTEGVGQFWDGTYVGDIVREFYVDNKYTVLDPDEPAVIRISLGPLTKYPGYYTANDGFLSDAIFIQDSHYYQAFSYVLKIDERLEKYRSVVKTMLHPTGMALFGEYDLRNEFDLGTSIESMIKYLALTFQDNVVTGIGETTTKGISKGLTETLTETDVYVSLLSKPLGSQLQYNGVAENTIVTLVDNDISTKGLSKPLGSNLLNNNSTLDTTVATLVDNDISAKTINKPLGSQYLNNGVSLEATTVTLADASKPTVDFTKALTANHTLNNGVSLDSESFAAADSVPTLLTTKYMDSEGSFTHYLNDGTTLDTDKATSNDTGGNLWFNPYDYPYPRASAYFASNYVEGESSFTG